VGHLRQRLSGNLTNAGVQMPLLETSMQQMQTSLEAQDALLNQMRDATLLENGQLVLRPEPTALVKKATEQVAARCRAEGLSLSFSLPEQELIAFCDPARIRRVLDNVLDNALRYTRAFRGDGGSIEVTIEHLKEMIECSVRDNGAGMSAEALASVGTRFTRFAEGDGAPEGTGQGLSFCKGIMELTGGEMLVTSPGPGKGTTVKLRLPRAGREKGQ
jgi:signal transduction histidine kinase